MHFEARVSYPLQSAVFCYRGSCSEASGLAFGEQWMTGMATFLSLFLPESGIGSGLRQGKANDDGKFNWTCPRTDTNLTGTASDKEPKGGARIRAWRGGVILE